jgi:hypothetical protein
MQLSQAAYQNKDASNKVTSPMATQNFEKLTFSANRIRRFMQRYPVTKDARIARATDPGGTAVME